MVLRKLSFGAPFTNEVSTFETEYDFSKDAGATGTLAMTNAASEALMVRLVAVKTETAPLGAGALLTVDTSTTADVFLNSEPIASFTLAGVFIPENATTGGTAGFVKVAAADTLDFTIEVAALTAGKLHFVWEVMKY
jgi:hypothetical protein